MLQIWSFLRTDIFPSWWANALGKFLSVASPRFQLVQSDNTHVQVPASANAGAAVLAIGGLWRWIEAPLTVAHPGGAAGTYPIFVTAKAENITTTPQPFTDATDYSFSLVILAPGATPTIVPGTVDVLLQVGNAIWDGAKITRVDQLVPVTPLHAGRHAVGGVDPLTPAMIGAVPAADSTVAQPGDLITSAAPTRAGCVLCDGTAYSRTGIYAALFAAIGTRFGAGDGSTTFNVPDYRDSVIVGASATRPLGTAGGENTHALTVAEMPVHAHLITDPGHSHLLFPWTTGGSAPGGPVSSGQANQWGLTTGIQFINPANQWNVASGVTDARVTGVTIQNAGGSGGVTQAHNNMQQFKAANVFIKL